MSSSSSSVFEVVEEFVSEVGTIESKVEPNAETIGSAGAFGSTFGKVEFNASITITELLSKTLENCVRDLASRCIQECGSRYGFDANVAIRELGLENMALIKKQMAKKTGNKGEKKPKADKTPKEKKSTFPLPFIASAVNLSLCNGLAYNRGLFTQCTKKPMEDSLFCKKCQAEADNSAAGVPKCGTVQQRLATGLYEFKDTTNRSPISYLKVLEKTKTNEIQAQFEAGKLSLTIDPLHFVAIQKTKQTKGKGRPKKTTTVTASNVNDLFAKLTAEGEEEPTEQEPVAKASPKKAKLTDEEKAAKKDALEAERAAKKAEKEAKEAAEKATKKAALEAERAAKKAEKEAKEAAEKAAREAKRQQEKAEREAKKAAEKEAAKAAKSKKLVATAAPDAQAPAQAPDAQAPAPSGKISVTRITIGGIKYMKSSDNILYNPETKEEVGLYDPETKTVKPLPKEEDEEEEDEEEEEEEYDEEN